MGKTLINECIIVHKKIRGTTVLVKNRDRAYKPVLEVVHEIRDGVEMVYLRDVITDWSEGMNQYGIGIVNTALMVGYDENEKKIVKKTGKPSKDGKKIREALSQSNIKDALHMTTKYMGGVNGHTFISTPNKMISVEKTSKHKARFEIHEKNSPTVRTNHGHIYYDAGYTDGDNYLSSKIRKISAEKVSMNIESPTEILLQLRKDFYDTDSNLNMRRKTDKMSTSSQLMLNLTDKVFELHYFKDKVERFDGITNKLPDGYTPKIKVVIKEINE